MLNTLLSFSQHPSLKHPHVLNHYVNSLYFLNSQHHRKFKVEIQSLLTSLIQLNYFDVASTIISELTKESLSSLLPTKPSSHNSSLSPKTLQLVPSSSSLTLEYIPNCSLSFGDFTFKAKADLAAIIFYTLLQSHDTPLIKRDIERLSQKYISLFPSLSSSTDWDIRYSDNRSRFCLFCTELLRKSIHYNLISKQQTQGKNFYSLLPLGLQLANQINSSISTQLAS